MNFKEIIEHFDIVRSGLVNGSIECNALNDKTRMEIADRFYDIYKDFKNEEKQNPGLADLDDLHELAVNVMSFMFYHSVQALTRPMGLLFIFVVELESKKSDNNLK
jgi:hypothetical protein